MFANINCDSQWASCAILQQLLATKGPLPVATCKYSYFIKINININTISETSIKSPAALQLSLLNFLISEAQFVEPIPTLLRQIGTRMCQFTVNQPLCPQCHRRQFAPIPYQDPTGCTVHANGGTCQPPSGYMTPPPNGFPTFINTGHVCSQCSMNPPQNGDKKQPPHMKHATPGTKPAR